MTEQNPEATAKTERSTALRKAYSNANTRLREEHRDEFEGLYVEEAAKLGVEYTPKPSKEERARTELANLLRENPSLKEQLIQEINSTSGADK